MSAAELKNYLQPRRNICSVLVKCLFCLLVSLQLLVETITAESKMEVRLSFPAFHRKCMW